VELKINPEEVSSILKRNIEQFRVTMDMEEIGRSRRRDGIARIKAFPAACPRRCLNSRRDLRVALNLEEDQIGAMILGDYTHIEQGDQVRRTGKVLSVPVEMPWSQVVNALGQPIDGKGPIHTDKFRLIEGRAPNVVERQP